MQISARMGRLRHVLEARGGPTALLVSSLTNVRYLTGFTGSAGMLFLLPGRQVLLTDGRYETQAGEQLDAAGVDATVAVRPAVEQFGFPVNALVCQQSRQIID